MKAAARQKLREGTALMRAAIAIAFAAIESNIGFSLENPRSSMVWEWEEMKALMRAKGVVTIDLVYCMYGMPWLKPTRIITNVKELNVLSCQCSCGQVHQTLRGVAPCGTLWTRIACPYPPRLCAAYGKAVRSAVLEGSLSHLRGMAAPRQEYAAHCRPVREHWHPEERWQLAWKGRWRYEEHINIQELRVVSGISRHLARSRRNWDQRHLVLTDSQVSLACCWKGRSRSFPLLRQMRRIAAATLALGIRLCLRWVPTQHNNADLPSRGGPVGVEKKEKKKQEEAAGAAAAAGREQELRFFRPNL